VIGRRFRTTGTSGDRGFRGVRQDLIGDERYATRDARLQRETEVDAIVTGWTKERTKQEAMAQLSAVGVPALGRVGPPRRARRLARTAPGTSLVAILPETEMCSGYALSFSFIDFSSHSLNR
jgi:anti-sigma factor RsiW